MHLAIDGGEKRCVSDMKQVDLVHGQHHQFQALMYVMRCDTIVHICVLLSVAAMHLHEQPYIYILCCSSLLYIIFGVHCCVQDASHNSIHPSVVGIVRPAIRGTPTHSYRNKI